MSRQEKSGQLKCFARPGKATRHQVSRGEQAEGLADFDLAAIN